MTLEEYKLQFDSDVPWFVQEVENSSHVSRISAVVQNRDYLAGVHKVLLRENSKYKGKELITRKTILNYAKTILKFHATYLLGKRVSLTGDEETVKTFNEIYTLGQYETVDYEILDRVNKFGDAYEVIYVDNGIIKSKVLDSGDSYPVYSDEGDYLAFIEHWTDINTCITRYNVYYPNYVEYWSNEGGSLTLRDTKVNVCGLPIHYHNFNDMDYNFGVSLLNDMRPIMDELEDIMSKMGDAIYVNTLNPLPVAIGQRIESSIPADAIGYILNLDSGDFKYANCQIDTNTIKLYLDNLKQMLNDIACMPSVIGSSTNIANISETSMKILFHLANLNADETKKWLNKGFQQRFRVFANILRMQGIAVNGSVETVYNVNMPVATTEMISNLKAMRELGAISIQTLMDKCDLISNTNAELKRVKNEKEVAVREENVNEQ